ncbi:succinate dehydrogenase cytochrome b subunit [Compostibacter hankyongensis]|uniref:Succinate dehydrogenase cytochrome b subunit n=1 Tax=Compostibacter hankyongensis TaxID=1007089 RepID=A0ABP8FH54_9BACT
MKWGQFFTSAIGKKIVIGFTGLFLILFLIVHCSINACIFVPDHGETFLKVAHFMGTNWIMHILEVGLIAGFAVHIIQALALQFQNRRKRPVRYAMNRESQVTNWYSRSMGLLGTLILIFLIIHWSNFWIPNRSNQILHGEELNLFERMKDTFSHGWLVIVYLVGVVSLSFHLMHGFQSAFRTFGMSSKKYIPIVRGIGTAFSILVPLIFALMPVLMYFNVIR